MRFLGILAMASLASSACARAEAAPAGWRRVVLVELFTSEGCSSCPAAEEFLRELPALGLGRDKVVPLAFHVDYWDGLGWPDRFADRAFTARQDWYARATRLRSPDGEAGLHGLYTPQLVVDGAVHLSGRRRPEAIRQIERAAAEAPLFRLEPVATVRGEVLDVAIEATALARPAGQPEPGRGLDWRLGAAVALRSARTAVTHGENAGETLEEAAVVRRISEPVPVPPRAGEKVHVRLTKPADTAWADLDVVVFAQSHETGTIGAAVQLPASRPAVSPR